MRQKEKMTPPCDVRLLLPGLKILPVSRVIVLEKNCFFLAKCLCVHVSVLTKPVSLGIFSLLWAGVERLLPTVCFPLYLNNKDTAL